MSVISLKTGPTHLHPLFEAHPAVWEKFSDVWRKRVFTEGASIISHGDAAVHLWLVLKGWVKLSRQTPDGKETIVGLCTEGDVFGEAALFAHANYPYHAEVIGHEVELAAIPAATIRLMIAQDNALSASIMAMLNTRTAQTQLKLEHMSTMSAAQRLGCFLLKLCHSQAHGERTLQIPVEKHVLAAYLGMKPETLSRSQQQLKPLGIHIEGSRITVQDIARLRAFVCDSCSQSGDCDIEDAAS